MPCRARLKLDIGGTAFAAMARCCVIFWETCCDIHVQHVKCQSGLRKECDCGRLCQCNAPLTPAPFTPPPLRLSPLPRRPIFFLKPKDVFVMSGDQPLPFMFWPLLFFFCCTVGVQLWWGDSQYDQSVRSPFLSLNCLPIRSSSVPFVVVFLVSYLHS